MQSVVFQSYTNAIVRHILHAANDIVFIHFLKVKCILILLYGLEAFELTRAQLSSIDFAVFRVA
jgi:hypothetical protein